MVMEDMFQILLLRSAEAFNKAAYVSDVAYSSVFDASYIKLREIKFGYTFKNSPKFPVKDLNVSFVGRNLAILSTNVPHIDPETAFSSGNVQGLGIWPVAFSQKY